MKIYKNNKLITFTQTEIAEKTGLSQPLISRYFKGEMMPSLERASLISKAMGISMEELLEVFKNNGKKK